MTTTEPTYDDVTAERARVLDQIDDLLNTAQAENRGLTDAERAEHDSLDERAGELEAELGRMSLEAADRARFDRAEARRAFSVPMVNLGRVEGPAASRSLTELFWATNEDVAAGGFDKTGRFMPHFGARASVDQVVVRDATDPQVEVLAPRLSEFRPEHAAAIRSFQRTAAAMSLWGMLVNRDASNASQGFEAARSHRVWADRWQSAMRALDVDTSGEGGTWVPTGIGAELHERVRASGKIAPLFSTIDLPTNPWKWPIEGSDATAYRVAEPTGDTESKPSASTPGTVAATFDAEIFGGRVLISRSLEADSALAIIPYITRKLVQAMVDAEEKAILDGDTDGTHQDSDVGASTTDARTAWDGLRKRAIANASNNGAGALTVALLNTTRGGMGKWGLNPAELVFIVGVSSFFDLLGDSNVVTVDKMGAQASILNGQLASVYGIPIIVSEHVRENLNASGVYDGITTTKTTAMCVNRQEWAMGRRMALEVETDDSIYRETYQRVLVGFMREDFQNIGDASSNDDTSICYNVTP